MLSCVLLGHYRLYLFPSGKDALNPKKVVDVKFLDVSGVESDSTRFVARTVNPVSELGQVSLRTDRGKELLTLFVAEWRRSYAFLPLPPITGGYDSMPLPADFSARRTGPFCAGYCGWSNYYDSVISIAFLNYVEELEQRGIVDLDLRECPGIESAETPGSSLNLVPVFASLRFDTYFHSIIMTGVQHREAISLVADAVRFNSWLTKVVVVDSSGDQEQLISFATALSDNKSCSLQMIDLSQHPGFGDRGMQALSLALAGYSGRITHLRLAQVGASGKGLGYLLAAFRLNYRFSLGLQYLNLAGNRFDGSSSSKLEEWIERAGGDASMQTLVLSSTGVAFSALARLKLLKELHTLDVSDCKVDSSSDTKGLASAVESSNSLTSIDLSGCGFTKPDFAEAVLLNIAARMNSASPLTLKLANNLFGSYSLGDFSRVLKAIQSIPGLTVLDMSALAPRDEQSITILLDSLRTAGGLQSLQLDSVRVKPKSAECLNSLWTFPQLRNLSLTSTFAPEVITTFLRAAPAERRLTELDISQNQLGDFGCDALAGFLRHDRALQSLKCEGNAFTISGWSSLITALRLSGSLVKISNPIPDLTFHKNLRSNGDDKNTLSAEYLARRLAGLQHEMQLLASRSPSREAQNVRITFGDAPSTSQIPTPTSAAMVVNVPERLSNDSAAYLNSKDEDMNSVVSNTKLSGGGALHRPSSVYKFDPMLLMSSAAQAGYSVGPPLSGSSDSSGGGGRQSMAVAAAAPPAPSNFPAPPPSFPAPPSSTPAPPPTFPAPPPVSAHPTTIPAPPPTFPAPPPTFPTAPPPSFTPTPPPSQPPAFTPTPPPSFTPTPPPSITPSPPAVKRSPSFHGGAPPATPPPPPVIPQSVPVVAAPTPSFVAPPPVMPKMAPSPAPPPPPPASTTPPPPPPQEDYHDHQYEHSNGYDPQGYNAGYDNNGANYGYAGYEESGYGTGYGEEYGADAGYGQSEYDDRSATASRPGYGATSAAALRQEKYQQQQQMPAEPAFGTITVMTGGGSSPFDTFRLPADGPELAAFEAARQQVAFPGARQHASSPAPAPVSSPPVARLGGVHKPPPPLASSAPIPRTFGNSPQPPSGPGSSNLSNSGGNSNNSRFGPKIAAAAPAQQPQQQQNSPPPWVKQQSRSPPTSPRSNAPTSFGKSPSTSSISPASNPPPGTSPLGIHKLPPGVSPKAPPANMKSNATSLASPPTSPRGRPFTDTRPMQPQQLPPSLQGPPSTQNSAFGASPKSSPFGSPRKIGFAEAPPSTSAPPPAGATKAPAGPQKLSHHSRSVSASVTTSSVVRAASAPTNFGTAPSAAIKKPPGATIQPSPSNAVSSPTISALKQPGIPRSSSVGANPPIINNQVGSPVGAPRPGPPKFSPGPSKFPPAPM